MPVTKLCSYAISQPLSIPLFLMPVAAGFPSPAEDFVEKTLDLNDLCIKHPAATYFVRVEGDSMMDAGIYHGDVLVVDRSLTAQHSDIVIAELEGEMTVKQLELRPSFRLVPRNRKYPAIEGLEQQITIFGVVTSVIRSLQR